MKHYYLECYHCEEETQVSSEQEPEYCPCCGEPVNATIMDDLDSDR